MPALDAIALRVEMPLGVEPNDDFAAFAGAFNIEAEYGLTMAAGTPSTLHYISVSTPDTEPQSRLHAVVRGRIRLVPAVASEPVRIELQPSPFELYVLGERLGGSILPALFLFRNVDLVAASTAATALLQSLELSPAERTTQLTEFIAGTRWLTVEAGAILGRPAVDAALSGRRRLDLAVQDRQGFFLNPAHFLFAWTTLRGALTGHPLLQALGGHHQLLFPMKSRTLLVQHDAPAPTAPYATADTAARAVNDAMVEAAPGDVICVIDNAVYDEKVFMAAGVTLTSAAILGSADRPAEADGNLPTLADPAGLSAAVVFEDLTEPTHISGFKISGGNAADGAGVVVDSCVNIEVAQCDIFGNTATHGGGIGIVDSRRVVISRCLVRDNQATDLPGGDKGQGGGIYVGGDSTDVTVEDCHVYRNQATNFGGGVCVDSPARRVTFRRNRIGSAAAADGNRVTLDRLAYEDSVVLDNPQGGGGGVGVFDTSVTLIENEIWHNEAHCGGGIEFYVRAYGRLVGNDIADNRTRTEVAFTTFPVGGDGGGIAVNNTSLAVDTADQHRPVVLIDNRIRNNVAEDDGGGIYGTAKAMIDISGDNTEISGNQARNNGGGVRVSFGSQLRIRGGVITSNRANDGGGSGGGGGVAARNSRLVLENCLIEDNQVNNFGGGGVYVVTLEEGGIGIPLVPDFDDLLTNGYRFSQLDLGLTGVTITDNTASGTKGAGAGLYVVYDEYDVHVKIDDCSLDGNHANHADAEKRKNVVFQDNSTVADPIDNDDDLASLSPLTGYDQTFSP